MNKLIENKLVYANHYEKITKDIDYPADEGMLIDDWKSSYTYSFSVKVLNKIKKIE